MESYRVGMWKPAVMCGLALLGLGSRVRADDVKVQPAPGSGFVVTDNTGASQRLKVLETGEVYLGGLVTSPPIKKVPLCFDATTGQVGTCPAVLNLCVPDAAASPRFVDNGDGTLTDKQTCRMWEKKTGVVGTPNPSDVHDVNNTYSWSTGSPWDPDGTAFFDFLAALNGPGAFAGHSDWRLPTPDELSSIVDPTQGNCGGGSGPCINPAFGPTFQANCYWSATTYAGSTGIGAWYVCFYDGSVGGVNKDYPISAVRAVRGGW